jgi:hypothetical protein
MHGNFPPVLTKQDEVRRFLANEFGNRGQNWHTYEEFAASGYRGLVHLRNRRVAGIATHYNVPAADVKDWWQRLRNTRDWHIAAMAPHHCNLLQGEVQQTERGLSLYYSTAPGLPMRNALAKDGKQVHGIISVCLLKHYLCQRSYEWLQVLLERYPGHVIEFSTFGVNWGTVPGMNTVFWEVRLY